MVFFARFRRKRLFDFCALTGSSFFQEQAGVKMVMIQDNQESGGQPKPLRISGDPEKVENARRMVEEILQSREDHPPGHFGFPGSYGLGGGQRSIGEVSLMSFIHCLVVLLKLV